MDRDRNEPKKVYEYITTAVEKANGQNVTSRRIITTYPAAGISYTC